MSTDRKLPIGISSCLLGQKVRFDGGHKQDRYILGTLGELFEWVPVCPEVEIGLGIPRETIRLVDRGGEVRLEAPRSGSDHTERMTAYAGKRVASLGKEELRGYLFKSKSPSCGVFGVKVYPGGGGVARKGRGLFSDAFVGANPLIPVEEEGRLSDPGLRENWIERVFAYDSLRALLDTPRWKVGDLVAFHTRFKMELLAHSPTGYREIGRLVAEAKGVPREDLARNYAGRFMQILQQRASRAKHTNVMQHMMGHLRGRLPDIARDDLMAAIERYRKGHVPRVVPVSLISHYVRMLDVAYLKGQTYLEPWPDALGRGTA